MGIRDDGWLRRRAGGVVGWRTGMTLFVSLSFLNTRRFVSFVM